MHTDTCRSDYCPLSDPRRQRSSPVQPFSLSRGDLRSWRSSLSWRLTHCWHFLDSSRTLRFLAVCRSLSDRLTRPSVDSCRSLSDLLFLLLAYRLPLRSTSFDLASSGCVLTLLSAAHYFVGPAADWRPVDPTAATKFNGPRPNSQRSEGIYDKRIYSHRREAYTYPKREQKCGYITTKVEWVQTYNERPSYTTIHKGTNMRSNTQKLFKCIITSLLQSPYDGSVLRHN